MMRKMGGWRLWLSSAFAGAVVAVAGAAGLGYKGEAHALTNCTVSDMSVDSEEQAFLGLINSYRAQNGRGALSMSTNLNRAATWHAADMGAKRYFSHTDSLGRSSSTRAQNCDYPGGAGENIAAGTAWSSAQSVFTAWRNSSGHNTNMLNSSYTKIGIARVYTSGSPYGWYWVTDFGLVNDGTSGGGGSNPTSTPTRGATATPTRTPTQAPASGSPASITSPSNGSTLSGASVTFNWSAASGALEYFFYAGSSQGSNSILGRSTGTGRSTTVANLPTNGSTVYVRLWTRFAAGWQYRDYTYTASNPGSGGGSGSGTGGSGSQQQVKATMTSPSPGSELAGSSATFSWNPGTGTAYYLHVGTTPGSSNLVETQLTGQSIALQNLPRGGQTLYVRLWTNFSTGWQYNDYTYRAAP